MGIRLKTFLLSTCLLLGCACTADALTLVLQLKVGADERHYAHATTPFVCPDMKR